MYHAKHTFPEYTNAIVFLTSKASLSDITLFMNMSAIGGLLRRRETKSRDTNDERRKKVVLMNSEPVQNEVGGE